MSQIILARRFGHLFPLDSGDEERPAIAVVFLTGLAFGDLRRHEVRFGLNGLGADSLLLPLLKGVPHHVFIHANLVVTDTAAMAYLFPELAQPDFELV